MKSPPSRARARCRLRGIAGAAANARRRAAAAVFSAAIVLCGTGAAAAPDREGALTAWVPTVAGTEPPLADAMARVPVRAPAGASRTARLWAARGETQGFAVAVKAPEGHALTSLSVAATALRCTSGACRGKAIPPSLVDAWRAMPERVATPSGSGDPAIRGRTNPAGPRGSGTLDDPGNGSMCGEGRPFGPPPCDVPDGLVPYEKCDDGSAPPCEPGDAKVANRCAVDGTGCGPGAPSFAVPAGRNQELWIEVRVPRGGAKLPAGAYEGTIRLDGSAGARLRGTISVVVNVWDFEVPASPAFRTGFGFNGGSQPSAFYNPEAQAMFAKRRVSLARYGGTSAMGVDDWPQGAYGTVAARLERAWGVPNALQVGPFLGTTGDRCVTSWSPADYLTAAAAREWVARYRLPTDGVLLYARNGDEIVSGLAEPGRTPHPYSSQRRRSGGGAGCAASCDWCTYRYLEEAARAVHATRDPEVKLLSVVDPNPHLVRDGADPRGGRPTVDVFVVAPGWGFANPSSVAAARSGPRPSEIWTYHVWLPDTYSPKWQLDYSPVSYRMGFIAQALGVSGAAVAEIAEGADLGCEAGARCPGGRSRPADDPWRNGLFKDVCGGGRGPNCATNGDSQWLYPAWQVGLSRFSVVPHLRLDFFRDGIQDYELVAILKSIDAGRRYREGACSPAFGRMTCEQVVRLVGGSDWSDYSTDAHLLQRARMAIGGAIAADPRRPRGAP